MDYIESRREAAERLVHYASKHGLDVAPYRDEHDIFTGRKRWVDFWVDGNAIGYHIRGDIGKLPAHFVTSQSSFRGVWDEAGSVENLQQAFYLLRFWVIDAKEVDELPDRKVHRSML
jgi:hypothetical protein